MIDDIERDASLLRLVLDKAIREEHLHPSGADAAIDRLVARARAAEQARPEIRDKWLDGYPSPPGLAEPAPSAAEQAKPDEARAAAVRRVEPEPGERKEACLCRGTSPHPCCLECKVDEPRGQGERPIVVGSTWRRDGQDYTVAAVERGRMFRERVVVIGKQRVAFGESRFREIHEWVSDPAPKAKPEPQQPSTRELKQARDAVIAAARLVDSPPYGGMTEARVKLREALTELEKRIGGE